MAKYIDKDKAYGIVLHYGSYAASAKIADMDGIEIIHCKECVYLTDTGWCGREFDWYPVEENDFCSMGERKDTND